MHWLYMNIYLDFSNVFQNLNIMNIFHDSNIVFSTDPTTSTTDIREVQYPMNMNTAFQYDVWKKYSRHDKYCHEIVYNIIALTVKA